MGYGINTTAFYGVLLSWDDTQKLAAAISQAFATSPAPLITKYDVAPYDELYSLIVQSEPSVEKNDHLELDVLVMVAEDSHSTLHTTIYAEGFDHGVGVYIADKGYGGRCNSAEFKAAFNGAHAEQERVFATHIQPLLDAAGITEAAGLNTVSYTA